MSLLKVSNIAAYYGSAQALFDVSLNINEGEVVALLGRNGMGKSTTIKSICKMLNYKNGDIEFNGTSCTLLPSHKVAQLGIGLVPEGRRCFPNLTVYENLIVAAQSGDWDFKKVTELFPRLDERRNQSSSTLSGGEQQMLAIGRALMTNPKLLILDEATEGLAPIVRQEIWDAINRLKLEGNISILIVDKSLKELNQVADRAVILERGSNVWQGDMRSLTPEISNKYIGV